MINSGITIKNKKVYFGGIAVEELSKKYSTPLYVFSEQRLIDNYNALLKAFRDYYSNTNIYFSVKTNFELQLLRSLKENGSNAEVASGMELDFALKAGFKPSQIVMDGAAWTNEEIDYCVKKGIKTFNVDSIDLLNRLHASAKSYKKTVNISFRIFPEIKMTILSGFVENYISKFGIPRSKAIEAYKYAKTLNFINPISISAHIGSMVTDPKYYENELDVLVNLADELNKKMDIKIREINMGGGFGVQSLNYYSIQSAIFEKAGVEKYHKAPPISVFGKRIAGRFDKLIKKYRLPQIELILEPGRFIVSDSGILLTNVVSAKYDKWIFVNGGINLIPESIFFIRRGFIVANKMHKTADHRYNIAGPTLNTADVLATNQLFPKTDVGDLIVILDSGAYSLTRSNQFTMMRPSAIYITKNKSVKYLRKKEISKELSDKMLL